MAVAAEMNYWSIEINTYQTYPSEAKARNAIAELTTYIQSDDGLRDATYYIRPFRCTCLQCRIQQDVFGHAHYEYHVFALAASDAQADAAKATALNAVPVKTVAGEEWWRGKWPGAATLTDGPVAPRRHRLDKEEYERKRTKYIKYRV